MRNEVTSMKIIWNSDNSIIPNYGIAEKGKEIYLPDDLCNIFITTGQAKAMPEPKSKKVTGEGE